MDQKKTIISVLAILSIAAAVYGAFVWQEKQQSRPVRQIQEIR